MKKGVVVWAIAAASMLMAGCSGLGGSLDFAPDTSSIYVRKDGTLESALVETFENKEYYSQESLQSFASELVEEYNQNAGSKGQETLPVQLKSCQLEGGSAKLIFQYASAEDLLNFAAQTGDDSVGTETLYVDTVGNALMKEKVIDGKFLKPDGTEVSNDTVTKQSSAMVIAAEGPVTVQTEGKILYVTEGVTVEEKNQAVTPEGKSYIVFK